MTVGEDRRTSDGRSIIIELSDSGDRGATERDAEARVGDVFIQTDHDGIRIRKDLFSTTPVFFYFRDRRLMASRHFSEVVDDYRKHYTAPALDREYLKLYLEFQAPCTSRTMARHICFVRAGTEVLLERSGVMSETLVGPTQPAASETEAMACLENELRALDFESTSFHISAGLDSTLLVLLAAQFGPSALRLVTCVTRGRGASDELPIAEKIADEVGGELSVFDFRELDLFECAQALLGVLPYANGYPSQILEFLIDTRVLEESDERVPTIVTGNGPDEVLGGHQWHAGEFSDPSRFMARRTVTSQRRLTEIFTFPVGPARLDAPDRDLSLESRLLYDIRSLAETWNILHDGLQSRYPIRLRHPFLAPAVRGFFFGLRDQQKVQNGVGKIYLRQRFKSVYPAYLLSEPKRGLRLDLAPYWREIGAEHLFRRLMESSDLMDRYVAKNPLKKMIEDTVGGTKNQGWQLWNLLLASVSYSRLEMQDNTEATPGI